MGDAGTAAARGATVGGWARRGCGMAMGSSACALGLPSISPPGWEPLRLGTCLGKATPSSRAADEVRRASSSLAVSCKLQQRNCKESSAAGSRGLVSEREKQRLAHPYLTFV